MQSAIVCGACQVWVCLQRYAAQSLSVHCAIPVNFFFCAWPCHESALWACAYEQRMGLSAVPVRSKQPAWRWRYFSFQPCVKSLAHSYLRSVDLCVVV